MNGWEAWLSWKDSNQWGKMWDHYQRENMELDRTYGWDRRRQCIKEIVLSKGLEEEFMKTLSKIDRWDKEMLCLELGNVSPRIGTNGIESV